MKKHEIPPHKRNDDDDSVVPSVSMPPEEKGFPGDSMRMSKENPFRQAQDDSYAEDESHFSLRDVEPLPQHLLEDDEAGLRNLQALQRAIGYSGQDDDEGRPLPPLPLNLDDRRHVDPLFEGDGDGSDGNWVNLMRLLGQDEHEEGQDSAD